jgi:protein SCO1/2
MMRRFACVLVLGLLPVAAADAQAPSGQPDVGIDQHLNGQVPLDLVFRDEQGKTVTLDKYFGSRPVILVLAYYRCPRLCSLVLNGLCVSLRKLDYEIGQEFEVVTVSFDPREQPELAAAKKASYVEHYGRAGAATGWHFLTGDEPSIKRLAEAVGFRYAYDAGKDQYAHASGIMVLTPQGKIARYFYGLDYPPRELQFGLEDASAGKIGSPIGRPLRLLCFSYDPETGKYNLMVLRLVRVGGVLTVLAFGVFVWWAWRRERGLRPGGAVVDGQRAGSVSDGPVNKPKA